MNWKGDLLIFPKKEAPGSRRLKMVKINNCKPNYSSARVSNQFTEFLNLFIYQSLLCFSAHKRFHALVKKMVTNHRKLSKKSTEEGLFIDALLDSTEDEQVILSDACSYIVAGFHTTGNCELNCFYVLSVYITLLGIFPAQI